MPTDSPAPPPTDGSPRTARRIVLRPSAPTTAEKQHFSVVVVCTAHHCRSPIMDAIWSARAREHFGPAWQVSSAGTDARPGLAVHPSTGVALAAAGFAPTVAAARALDAELIRSADLVLTAERRHRAEVVAQVPAAVNRTFTLREFARLAGTLVPGAATDPVAAGHDQLLRVRQARADHPPVDAHRDNLPDPMGRGPAEFADCVHTVLTSVDRILGACGPARPPRG